MPSGAHEEGPHPAVPVLHRTVLVLPGVKDPPASHWQSAWENKHKDAVARVQHFDWTCPRRQDWTASIDAAVARCFAPPVIVAEGLGCLGAVHWCHRSIRRIHALVLASFPDPGAREFPKAFSDFVPLPPTLRRRRVLVIAGGSSAAPGMKFAQGLSRLWDADLLPLGHDPPPGAGPADGWEDGWQIILKLGGGRPLSFYG